MATKFRPSHADYTYQAKFGIRNWQGGGRTSARETIGRVAAGAVARKILRARIYELELEKKQKELQAVEDSKLDIAWGSQIRSYVLHPYRMVKDHRTKHETSNTDRVLDGDLDEFIYRYLIHRGGQKRGVDHAEARKS